MIFGFFPTGHAGKVAESLAQEIARRYPPLIANNPEQTVSQRRVYEVLDETFARSHHLDHPRRRGILSRAMLGNAFKWELREIGYEEKFVKLATERLVDRLAVGSK